MAKVFLTGADGLLGNNIVRELLKRKYTVKAFVLDGVEVPTLSELAIEISYGNILDLDGLLEAATGYDYIIHAAANTSIWPYRSEIIRNVNIEGTRNILRVAQTLQVKRLVAIGTANSFGNGSLDNPGDENSPFSAGKFGLDYIDSKLQAQNLILDAVKNDGLDAIILNPTFMIGPYDTKPSSGELLLALYHGRVPGYTAGGKNYIDARDVAVAACNGLTRGTAGECYIMANENLSYKNFNKLVAKELGVKPPGLFVPKPLILVLGFINELIARLFNTTPGVSLAVARLSLITNYYDAAKAIRELDLPQTPIKEAVHDAFQWFKDNGYLERK